MNGKTIKKENTLKQGMGQIVEKYDGCSSLFLFPGRIRHIKDQR